MNAPDSRSVQPYRTLEALEQTPNLKVEHLFVGEGASCRIARIQQKARDRVAIPTGTDHTFIIDLSGCSDVVRWKRGKTVDKGSKALTTATMAAFGSSDWRFAFADTLQIYVPDSLLRELAAQWCGDGEGLEIIDVLGVEDATAKHLALSLLAECRSERFPALFVDAIALSFAQLLLGRFSNRSGHPGLPRTAALLSSPDDACVRQVIDYVESQLATSLTSNEIAAAVNMRPAALMQVFKATTGETLWSFVLSRRIARAQELLAAGTMPLAEIAYACGFASQSHMTDVFRQKLGVTPGRYRKEVRC